MDLRSRDLSGLNLRSSLETLSYARFNDSTAWPAENQMPQGFDPKHIMELGKHPGPGIRDLHTRGITGKGIGIAIINYYHQKIHRHLLMPPIMRYQQGILGDDKHSGCGYPEGIENEKAFLIDFLPIHFRKLRRDGIALDHITYYSPRISPLIADREKYGKVLIRRDPRDLSCIYLLDPVGNHRYMEVSYRHISRPTISLWEHRQARKYVLEKGLMQVDEDKIFKAVEVMRTIAKEASIKSNKVRRHQARRHHLAQTDVDAIKLRESPSKEEMIDLEKNPPQPFDDIEVW